MIIHAYAFLRNLLWERIDDIFTNDSPTSIYGTDWHLNLKYPISMKTIVRQWRHRPTTSHIPCGAVGLCAYIENVYLLFLVLEQNIGIFFLWHSAILTNRKLDSLMKKGIILEIASTAVNQIPVIIVIIWIIQISFFNSWLHTFISHVQIHWLLKLLNNNFYCASKSMLIQ